jgi:exodeoxyribonuclease VII large subunit
MPAPVVHSVSEVTAHIKARFEEDALLSDVWLTGEVSNFKQHTSGHCYLTLKDETSSIKAVIWRTTASRLEKESRPRCVPVYEPQGAYQLYISHVEPAGLGSGGVRATSAPAGRGAVRRCAQAPPESPECIGIVTSPTGAAFATSCAYWRRFPREVILRLRRPGDAAPLSIVNDPVARPLGGGRGDWT